MGGEPGCDQKNRGLYGKYLVSRTDKSDFAGKKHDGCEYFVLDLTHDRFAVKAIRVYAIGARLAGYDQLSADLFAKVKDMEKRFTEEDNRGS